MMEKQSFEQQDSKATQTPQSQNAQTALKGGGRKYSRRSTIITMALCVIASFVLWLYVMEVDSPVWENEYSTVKVEVRTTAPDGTDSGFSAMTGGVSQVVDVVLRGRKTVLSSLKADDIVAYVDASAVTTAGKDTYPVKVDAPNGTSLVSCEPSELTVYLDKKVTKEVPVSVKLSQYTISSEYIIGEKVPSVQTVLVTGPESELAAVEEAQLVLSPTGSITGSFSGTGMPQLVDASGAVISSRYLSMNVSEISANVNVYIKKTIKLTATFKYGYLNEQTAVLEFDPPQVEVRGDVQILSGMDSFSVGEIDETKFSSSQSVMQFQPEFPYGITPIEPLDAVTVKLRMLNAYEKTVAVDQFHYINVPAGKQIEAVTESLNVQLRGALAVLNQTTASDISVTVDLKNLDPSSHADQIMTAQVTLNRGASAEMYIWGEYTVTLHVK